MGALTAAGAKATVQGMFLPQEPRNKLVNDEQEDWMEFVR
jgi:hypothetical protein